MSWIELTDLKGNACFLRSCCISGMLADSTRKTGCIVYCDPPIEALAVKETAEDVFAMLYVEDEDEDEDEYDDEAFERARSKLLDEDDDEGDYDDMLLAWFNLGKKGLVPE